MLRILLSAIFCFFTATAASAQEESRAILVLDASGSMWGQIEGVNKITIAQEVVGNLLTTLPENQLLGLVAYGHRRKGDCGDIETLHLPGVARATIADTVNALRPRGKTPLSAAVIQAAEALKYTENAATVILISDGIETCRLDPCEVGRNLEETGVDFTAHVIGFDVTDPVTQAQLQCLAKETGGTYLPADNADELAEALQKVAEATPAPTPAPLPVAVTFRATEGENGPDITDQLVWKLFDDSGTLLVETTAQFSNMVFDKLPGAYRVEGLRAADEENVVANFTLEGESLTITLVFPVLIPPASLSAPQTAIAGSLVAVQWSGPDGENDFISSADIDMGDGFYHHYTYTGDSEGDVVMVRMPPKPGTYEIRYVLNNTHKVIARREIEVTPLKISLDAPTQAVAGSTLQLGWDGPDYEGDFITISSLDQGDSYYVNYEYTREGKPLALVMPTQPGTYEIRYVLGASREVPARTTIDVIEVMASIEAHEAAPAGAEIMVTWDGPDYKNDYIAVAEIGSLDASYLGYTYTREGNPTPITLPLQAGQYELRYIANQDKTVLARRIIDVTPVTATLQAAQSATIGANLDVIWTGPGYKNDHITIAKPGEPAGRYENYTYTRDGSPLTLQMPTKPGEYELRYVLDGTEDVILARMPITIQEAIAQIKAPDTAPAGSKLVIDWHGPDEVNDHITIAKPDDRPGKYESFAYTRYGSPLTLQMPTKPGEYELRYILRGSDRSILARIPITITAVSAALDAPDSAVAGSEVAITWVGPEGNRDHLTIAEPGDRPSSYEAFVYVRDGNPLRLQMPTTPGEYELRYIAQGTERDALVRKIITLTPANATLDAPTHAPAGSTLMVSWSGPENRRDHLAIAEPGDRANKYETHSYLHDGNPLSLRVPTKPGTYELRYIIQGSDRSVLERQTLVVEPVTATLKSEPSVLAGENLVVHWQGPDYHNDYIAISRIGSTGYESFAYTNKGNPLVIKAPNLSGIYELRYVTNRDRITITSQRLEVQ